MTNRVSVGRGLAALIPTEARERPPALGDGPAKPHQFPATEAREPEVVEGLGLITVEPSDVAPNPRQPRQQFDPDALAELTQSLKEVGFLQPIVIRLAANPALNHKYELVAGERRLRASQAAGFSTIPALLRTTDDDSMLRDSLLENLQRVALNPLEEAAAYEQLLSDFGGTHEELAERLGRSRPQVSNTLRLLKLPLPVQNRVAAGVLSAGHARALLSLGDSGQMQALAKRVVAEGISVRGLEEIVAVGTKPRKTAAERKQESRNPLPELAVVSERLSDVLDTRVQITMSKSKGRISIEFAGIEDLHRIVTLLGDGPDPHQ